WSSDVCSSDLGGSVSGPAGVGDAGGAEERAGPQRLGEGVDPAGPLFDVDPGAVLRGDACGVIPPVLQVPQPVDEHVGCVPRPNVPNDAAHDLLLVPAAGEARAGGTHGEKARALLTAHRGSGKPP